MEGGKPSQIFDVVKAARRDNSSKDGGQKFVVKAHEMKLGSPPTVNASAQVFLRNDVAVELRFKADTHEERDQWVAALTPRLGADGTSLPPALLPSQR